MSRLLSKLEPRDNADFGREMHREKKEENVSNLIKGFTKRQLIDREERALMVTVGKESVVVENPTIGERINTRTLA